MQATTNLNRTVGDEGGPGRSSFMRGWEEKNLRH